VLPLLLVLHGTSTYLLLTGMMIAMMHPLIYGGVQLLDFHAPANKPSLCPLDSDNDDVSRSSSSDDDSVFIDLSRDGRGIARFGLGWVGLGLE
jgi:hypothetical protein